MLPSYLSTKIAVPEGAVCAVLDAGGTNLRTARAVWDGNACLIGAARAAWAEKM